MAEIVTGEQAVLPFQIYKENAAGAFETFDIDTGATVESYFKVRDQYVINTAATSSSGDTGAAYGTSLIIVTFPASSTQNIKLSGTHDVGIIETHITISGIKTIYRSEEVDIYEGRAVV